MFPSDTCVIPQLTHPVDSPQGWPISFKPPCYRSVFWQHFYDEINRSCLRRIIVNHFHISSLSSSLETIRMKTRGQRLDPVSFPPSFLRDGISKCRNEKALEQQFPHLLSQRHGPIVKPIKLVSSVSRFWGLEFVSHSQFHSHSDSHRTDTYLFWGLGGACTCECKCK